MGRARRFKVDILNAGLGQLIAEIFGIGTFHRTNSQEQDLDLVIERGGIRKHSVIGCLRIECAPKAAGASAESAYIGEFVEVWESRHERLHASHR